MSEKALEMRRFQVYTYPEEPDLAPSWVAGVLRDGEIRETTPMQAVGRIIDAARMAKTEILDSCSSHGTTAITAYG